MEYTKILLILYRQTGDAIYLAEADRNIDAYQQRMLIYGDFPGLYDAHSHFYQTDFYCSVRQTGWVIGLEQVLTALRAVAKALTSFYHLFHGAHLFVANHPAGHQHTAIKRRLENFACRVVNFRKATVF